MHILLILFLHAHRHVCTQFIYIHVSRYPRSHNHTHKLPSITHTPHRYRAASGLTMCQAPDSSQLPVKCVHFYLSFQTWIHTSYAKTPTASWDVDTAGSSRSPEPPPSPSESEEANPISTVISRAAPSWAPSADCPPSLGQRPNLACMPAAVGETPVAGRNQVNFEKEETEAGGVARPLPVGAGAK